MRLQVLAPAQLDRVRERVDPAHVTRRPQRDAEALSLADRVGRRAAVLPHPLATVAVEDRPRRLLPAGPLAQRVAVVATRHEADLLAFGLVGRHEIEFAGDRPDLRLCQVTERKTGVLELILAEAVEEVGLVLVGVDGSGEARRTVRGDQATRIVTRRDRLAVVEVPRAAQQRPELHVRVAVDARARGPTIEIRVEERLEDAGIELALEVHDVERDSELGGDPPGVIGRVERATALLELRVGIGDVVETHPDADGFVTLACDERGGDRRIHSPGHRHEDPAHTPTPWPSGSAATATEPTRIEAMTRGTISVAVSISASVVVRPSDKRRAPRASSSG